MEKRLGVRLQNMDAYLNVVGGMKIDEPATDLAAVAALYSSFRDFEVSPDWLIMGEVGLTGEVRNIQNAEKRVQEGGKLGFSACILPRSNAERLKKSMKRSGAQIGRAHV